MNERSLRLLEFDEIRSRVASRALSDEAAQHILSDFPQLNTLEVKTLKGLVVELHDTYSRPVEEPREYLPTIGPVVEKLKVEGTSLDMDEAYALGLFIQRSRHLIQWLKGSKSNRAAQSEMSESPLQSLLTALPDCTPVETEIFSILDRDGNLRDLPELREIRSRLQSLHKELDVITSRYTTNEESRKMLQSEVPSQRDGRIVLAVKANFKGRIKGIVHEVSSTGQTIFIEPEDIIEKNNEIVVQEQRLAAEVARILRELTSRIAVHRESLVAFHTQIIYLETLRARSRYSWESRGTFAIDITGEHQGPLQIIQGRHPLLGSKAVPIDLSMDSETRTVIITGPNTGGKTVTLKTVGLFILMNQFGLAVPAAEGTSLPLVDGVYADIGDEQSISQSLSTFSSHMTNIASIIAAATSHSLVLLDELGSGTDPEEGSAIAMALLDHFIETGARVLVTTHHSILKNYGYTKPNVQNASVDFDSRTLSPTYHIIMGIPGESRALEIASRNGLPQSILDRARSYLDEERTDVSALIIGLKEKHRELDRAVRDKEQEERRLREERRKADLRELRLRQKELELKQQGMGELRTLLLESRKKLENLVREIREGELTREKTLAVKDFISSLESAVKDVGSTLEAEALQIRETGARLASEVESEEYVRDHNKGVLKTRPVKALEFLPGAEVLYGPAKRRGKLVRQAKKGYWIVELGAIKMTLPETELQLLSSQKKTEPQVFTQVDLAQTAAPALALNVRGYRLEDALEALRKQIDGAALSGLYEFSVIHGKGDGILQRGVHEYLKQHPLVADYYFARPEEGGFGKTLVFLKRS
ncbi:endonuclease MutS2 [Gracilinema caldarium]|uniref:Endonuclease MutS2 n=1 Tax=Gracilinema caldarium (strain ATCC 51460 / DSM 7334 / H1) TaxID=744872 RepID=F8F0G6_GRAC1|nr:endonuclease MutS2 [Gracilinema caldarium]AEJ19310.1 MutS2 protein [Gracilinema caldarium DSM 7334]